MRTRIISEAEVHSISITEESHFFERKLEIINGHGLQKIVVAFANADGGELLIGIADDKEEPKTENRWHGFKTQEEFNSHLQNIFDITPSVNLRYEFLKCETKQNYILRVLVEKSQEVHKTTNGIVYQRYGAQSLPIKDPQRIIELSYAKGANSFEDQILKYPPEIIVEAKELDSFLNDYSPKTDPLDFVVGQNLLDHNTWEPKVAAVLLFHENPSNVMPRKCALKIARYETKEDDPEREHLLSQTTIMQPFFCKFESKIPTFL